MIINGVFYPIGHAHLNDQTYDFRIHTYLLFTRSIILAIYISLAIVNGWKNSLSPYFSVFYRGLSMSAVSYLTIDRILKIIVIGSHDIQIPLGFFTFTQLFCSQYDIDLLYLALAQNTQVSQYLMPLPSSAVLPCSSIIVFILMKIINSVLLIDSG